jgi:type II secretory pathway pseudopilin PulG
MSDPRNTGSGQKAFTLAELLVATSITIIMIALLGRVLIASTAVWLLADQRVDAFRDARAALQLMTNDLSRANINGDARMLTLSNYATDNSYAKEVYVIVPTKNRGKSDLCAVGYYLDWDGTSRTYSLKRYLKDSDTTLSSLAKSSPDFTTLYSHNQVGNNTSETLASYVWDLRISPGELADPITVNADPSSKWQWVEIRFKAMSVKAGRKLQSNPAISQATWADPTSTAYKNNILPSEQQFVTRVPLQQNQ